jgi:hypothetical protein
MAGRTRLRCPLPALLAGAAPGRFASGLEFILNPGATPRMEGAPFLAPMFRLLSLVHDEGLDQTPSKN